MSSKLKIVKEENQEHPWYAEGLNFKCTSCGQCCTGSPGYTWVSEQEIQEMADFLKISVSEFGKRYLRKVHHQWALIELAKRNYDCVFLKENKCMVYQVRPKQCRTFPWWPATLKNREAWTEAAKHCEGINLDAPLVPYETIEEQLTIQNS